MLKIFVVLSIMSFIALLSSCNAKNEIIKNENSNSYEVKFRNDLGNEFIIKNLPDGYTYEVISDEAPNMYSDGKKDYYGKINKEKFSKIEIRIIDKNGNVEASYKH